jgi:uncharacterized protein YcfL
MKKIIFLLFIAFMVSGIHSVQAQKKFEKTTEKDGVTFFYKWRPSEIFKKDAPLALIIRMDNKNDNPVKITFNVKYYWGLELKATSSLQEVTIKPNKTFTYNLKKKGFDNYTFSNEDLKDEDFNFELVKINIEKLPKKK